MKKKILTEAAGSLTAGYLINAVKNSGNISVATDAMDDCFGKFICDEFYKVPYATDPDSKNKLFDICLEHKIDIVIPTLDDSLMTWANMSTELRKKGTYVAISESTTLEIFLDKWKTYLFFKKNGIPTPETSLEQKYPLVKPRFGRGGSGIKITTKPVDMKNNISQVVLTGTEYTIDVFCDKNSKPIYIVPRVRLGVKEGKATGGVVIYNKKMVDIVYKICDTIPFLGPINIQCFETPQKEIYVTEINPRLGGGSALGMEATENWITLIRKISENETIEATQAIRYGLKMGRYYNEVFYE